MIVFEAKTTDSYVLKNFFELNQLNVKNVVIEISANGIDITYTNSQNTVLIHSILYANRFQKYRFEGPHTLHISIVASYIFKMLKSIKKRDTIILFIDDERNSEFGITVIPRDGDQKTTSYIKMQTSQCVQNVLPKGYSDSVLITPVEFNKFIKDANIVGSDVEINANKYQIKVVCQGSVFTKEIIFGDSEYSAPYDTSDHYSTDQFIKITKLACLGNNIQLCTKEKYPLLLKSQIGSLGDIHIYIKSLAQTSKK